MKFPLCFRNGSVAVKGPKRARRQWRLFLLRKAIKRRRQSGDRPPRQLQMPKRCNSTLPAVALFRAYGITDSSTLIRTLINCTRAQIKRILLFKTVCLTSTTAQILRDNYTRNKIRHNVLPQLENRRSFGCKILLRFGGLPQTMKSIFGPIDSRERGLWKVTPYGIRCLPIVKRK